MVVHYNFGCWEAEGRRFSEYEANLGYTVRFKSMKFIAQDAAATANDDDGDSGNGGDGGGQEDGSTKRGLVTQVWRLEFNSRDPHGEGRKPTPGSLINQSIDRSINQPVIEYINFKISGGVFF